MLDSYSSNNLNFKENKENKEINSGTAVENIKCFVRCRPLNEKEKALGAGCIKVNDYSNSIVVENKTESKNLENKKFIMDLVFSDNIEQQEIFTSVAVPVLKGFLEGYNCTIFAYGQTGAGKTHTMMGPLDSIFEQNSPKHGFIPRILQYIFNENSDEIKKVLYSDNSNKDEITNLKMEIKCSCLEIYQENIIDLLNMNTASEDANKLSIREDAKRGMFIDGLSEIAVKSDKSAKELVLIGLKNRHVAATSMNAESSRSHLIFTIFMNLSYKQSDMIISKSSRLHLIDLAGSERQKATKAVGERIKEAGMINKSLSTLGNVINGLVEMSEGKTKYVPFRDSKLTYFLKDSLGGNAKTTVIANISQSVIQLQETISTLTFVQRAKMIKNKAVINENVNDGMRVLQLEIKKLKEELVFYNNNNNKITNISQNDAVCQNCKNNISSSNLFNLNISEINNKVSPCENNITTQGNINSLISNIENLFSYENILIDKFRITDPIAASSIEKFFVSKEIYENDFSKLIENLDKKLKQFNNMVKFKENILNEIKDEVSKFIKDNVINKLFIEKINLFIDELLKFKSDFEVNDLLSLTKLKEENKQMKNELEALNYLKEYYNNKSTTKYNDLYEKQNVDNLNNIVSEFIESNKNVKTFFQDNFGIEVNGNYNKLFSERIEQNDGNKKFSLIKQTEFEKLQFQLEELKINEENNLKMIDDLQSETFLLNMELAKFKEETLIQFNKNERIQESDEESDTENKNKIKENLITDYKENEEEFNETPKGKNKNGKRFSLPNDPNFNPFQIHPDTEIKSQNTFLKNLRNSLFINSPNKQIPKSSLLYSGNQNTNLDTHNGTRNSILNLSRENVELIKLKEKNDDLLISLEERNTEANEKNAKIDDLSNIIQNMKFEIEQLQNNFNFAKEESETLFETNNVLSYNLESLNEKFNSVNDLNKELDVSEQMNCITVLSNELFNIYKDDLDYVKNISDIFMKIKSDNIKIKSSMLKMKLMEEENKNFKIKNQNIEILKKEEENSNFYEIKKIYEMIKVYDNNHCISNDIFIQNLSDKLDISLNKIKKLELDLDKCAFIIKNEKEKNTNLKSELIQSKDEIQKIDSQKKEIENSNFNQIQKIYEMIKVYDNNQIIFKDIFTQNLNDKLDSSQIKINKIEINLANYNCNIKRKVEEHLNLKKELEQSNTEIEKNKITNKEVEKSNFEERSKIYKMIQVFDKNQILSNDSFIHKLNEKLKLSQVKINKIETNTKRFTCHIIQEQDGNNYLKSDLMQYKAEIEIIKKKLKLFFGNDFNYENFINETSKKLFTFDKSKLSNLEKKIFDLKEEKKRLKGDIALLQCDFSTGLSDYSLNSKIQLLMRVKEENYKLKMDMIEIKKKNDALEKHITKLEETNEQFQINHNQSINISSVNNNFTNNYSNSIGNFDEILKIKKEHKELIERILEIDVKHKCKDGRNKFLKALEILKKSHEIIELNKFHNDVKSNPNNFMLNNEDEINFNNSSSRKLDVSVSPDFLLNIKSGIVNSFSHSPLKKIIKENGFLKKSVNSNNSSTGKVIPNIIHRSSKSGFKKEIEIIEQASSRSYVNDDKIISNTKKLSLNGNNATVSNFNHTPIKKINNNIQSNKNGSKSDIRSTSSSYNVNPKRK